MPSSWSAGASGKQAKKQVKSKRACEQKLIVKERESLQAYFYIPHFINSPPPLTSKRLWSRRVLCASRVRLRVHFPPKLFMSIEGNIVYVLQIFPRKKRGPILFWDKSPPRLFHTIWTEYRFFFLSLVAKGWLMLLFPTVWTCKTKVYHCLTGEGCYNR